MAFGVQLYAIVKEGVKEDEVKSVFEEVFRSVTLEYLKKSHKITKDDEGYVDELKKRLGEELRKRFGDSVLYYGVAKETGFNTIEERLPHLIETFASEAKLLEGGNKLVLSPVYKLPDYIIDPVFEGEGGNVIAWILGGLVLGLPYIIPFVYGFIGRLIASK